MLIEVGLQCVYLRLNTLGVGIADVGGGGVKITAYRYCGGGRGRCQEILCFFGGCCDADFKFFERCGGGDLKQVVRRSVERGNDGEGMAGGEEQ